MNSRATTGFQQAWEATYRHAALHSPYYRELFRGATGVPRLEEVPTVDKTVLSERNLDFLCVPRERVVEIVSTSGTTGRPLLWMLTEPDLQRLALNERLSFECAGLTANDTVLVAVAMDRCFMAGLAYWLGLREIGCGIVRAGASSPMLVLEMIERAQPTAVVAVPSFLRVIADKAREMGFDLAACSVKKAICIGEPVRGPVLRGSGAPQPVLSPLATATLASGAGAPTGGVGACGPCSCGGQAAEGGRALALNAAGRAIEAAWGARVYSTYGVTELANSLCECDASAGGHLHDEQLHVEVLDDAGQPVGEGEVGEVVATTFGVEAMPLIRYRTGDCAALFRAPCACGRATPRLGPILGRKNQKLKFKGTSLFPSALQSVLEEAEGVEAFVIVARTESELSDSVEVLVQGVAPLARLREALQARARLVPQVRLASREEIEALQMPPQIRKRRTFVDLR